jgi:putative SOS response-associated peptidase YedK
MCGRFTLTADGDALVARFGLVELAQWSPRYNIAPSQQILALRAGVSAAPTAVLLKWGLVPSWSKDSKIGNRLINARAETVAEKPAFRAAFARRRCLVLADGYFEWAAGPHGKQPYYIKPAGGDVVTIAALWEHWTSPGGEAVESCTLLTTDANRKLAPIHDRMPVILPTKSHDDWLDPKSPTEAVKDWLRPAPDDAFDPIPVSRIVNSPKNDVPACIEPLS